MQQNVLVVVFNTESEGYQAITELKKENHGADWIVTEAEMQRLARMELRKQRNDDFKAKVEEKRANIKEFFEKKKAEREGGEA